MLMKHRLMSAAIALALSATGAQAAVSAADAAKLGSTLTPFGAEKAGNADGSIPAWAGGITQAPAGYKGSGQHHVDPFPDDKPLFTITKANLEQYQDHLTPGQLALFRTYPDSFQMPVYQTRRSASAPQWVYDNTIKNATSAKLADGGNGFIDAYGGIPFPIPQSGVEALWNHIARYRGTYIVRRASEVAVQRNGSYSLVTSQQEALFKYYLQNGSFADLNNIMFYYLSFTTSPARLAGGATLVHETLDQVKEPRQAWIYNAGQRRVRRAPQVAYDGPGTASDGMRTTDNFDMFSGAPDRYDWKLIGKKELYIPYNSYEIASSDLKYKDIIKAGHVNQDLARYELHRVWEIEATLKSGERNIYAKRRFFVDEDSWTIVQSELYDGRGQLWRVGEAHSLQYYQHKVPAYAFEALYDIISGRYIAIGMSNEEKPHEYGYRASARDFTPAALRNAGVR